MNTHRRTRRTFALTRALALAALCAAALALGTTRPSTAGLNGRGAESPSAQVSGAKASTAAQDAQAPRNEPEVARFRESVGGRITPVIVELRGEPGVFRKVAAELKGERMSASALG
jgi:hypothetical protein